MKPASLRVVVYRATRAALDVRQLVRRDAGAALAVVAFVADDAGDEHEIDGVQIIAFDAWRAHRPKPPCLLVSLDPAERRAQAHLLSAAGGEPAGLRPSGNSVSPSVVLGEGTIFVPGPMFVSRARIGRHVIVMPYVSIAHDCVIGDFATIYASAVLSGYVVLEDDVVVGPGAIIANGTPERALRVGRGARVAAGAVVTKTIPAGALVTGNPGRIVAAQHLPGFDHEG